MNYENISLEKGMYSVPGKSFSEVLEELDPTEQYSDGLRDLGAFGRQLKRFDIRVSGPSSDRIQKFFSTGSSAALFPEYVSRAVRQGMEEADLLPSIVATTTHIDGMDYRTINSNPAEDDKKLKQVAEGAAIPETNITTEENLVKLNKRGRLLVASYEAIKFQRIDLFTVTLKQIGAYIARQQFKDAVDVLKNGDGNSNAAPTVSAATAGTLGYADLLALYNKLDPYDMTTLIGDADMMIKLLSLDEFKNPLTGVNFQGTGRVGTPLGAQFIKSAAAGSGKLIALDKKCALEMVVAGDVNVEYDKLIDRQLERAAITSIAGFAKIFKGAGAVLNV